jgi:hypothetical protein
MAGQRKYKLCACGCGLGIMMRNNQLYIDWRHRHKKENDTRRGKRCGEYSKPKVNKRSLYQEALAKEYLKNFGARQKEFVLGHVKMMQDRGIPLFGEYLNLLQGKYEPFSLEQRPELIVKAILSLPRVQDDQLARA